MFSGRQLIRELQRVRQDVDAVGERLDKYEQNIERLDKCVERLEEVIARWEGTRASSEPGAPPIADLMAILSSLSGSGLEASLGPAVTRLLEAIGPMILLARTLQNTGKGSMRIDLSKVSKEGVASLLLIGLAISVIEDKLREGVESIVEVASRIRACTGFPQAYRDTSSVRASYRAVIRLLMNLRLKRLVISSLDDPTPT